MDVEQSIKNSEIIIVAVGTPTKMEGYGKEEAGDIRYLEAAVRAIKKASEHLDPGTIKIVVERSTVPVKTAE